MIESTVIQSHPESAHDLVSALEAGARQDIYWSNEYFYRWLAAVPPKKLWHWPSIFARRLSDILVEVAGEKFVVRRRHAAGEPSAGVGGVAANLTGAAVAWARWLAKAGRDAEGLREPGRRAADLLLW